MPYVSTLHAKKNPQPFTSTHTLTPSHTARTAPAHTHTQTFVRMTRVLATKRKYLYHLPLFSMRRCVLICLSHFDTRIASSFSFHGKCQPSFARSLACLLAFVRIAIQCAILPYCSSTIHAVASVDLVADSCITHQPWHKCILHRWMARQRMVKSM